MTNWTTTIPWCLQRPSRVRLVYAESCLSRLEPKQSAVDNKNANSVRGDGDIWYGTDVMVIFDRMSYGFWILASSWKSKLCAGRLRRQTEIEANISDAMWMSFENFPSIVSRRRRRRRWWFEFSPVPDYMKTPSCQTMSIKLQSRLQWVSMECATVYE